MGQQILHILSHGARLHKEHGFLVCSADDGRRDRRMPLEDIRAVVIAARGVSLSSAVLSALCEHEAILLHCGEDYQPAAITAACSRTVDRRAAEAQARTNLVLHQRLWRKILVAKLHNQIHALHRMGATPPAALQRQVESSAPNESHAARLYWREFFRRLGEENGRRDRRSGSPANKMLNYGYAVLSALVHRSVVAHGLNPLFGVHHEARYRSYPLVYDLMEPLRPAVDLMLYLHSRKPGERGLDTWCRHVAETLVNTRVQHKRRAVKLLNALDLFVVSVANCFAAGSVKPFWAPEL